jgi:glycosyltransferase involved in cell wall biosynthesis
VPNGATDALFDPPPPRAVAGLRAALGLEGRPTVAYVGAISNIAHGVGLLLEAFALLRRELPAAALLLAGDGDDRPELMAMAQSLGLADTVRWTGRLPHHATRACYTLAACSVDPVHNTPAARARAPLKIVESMAQGVPVVAGNVGDRAETLAGRAGVIVAPGDPAALANGMARLLMNKRLRAQLAEGARTRAEDFRWERLAKTWMGLYG